MIANIPLAHAVTVPIARTIDPLSLNWWVTTIMVQVAVVVAYAASSLPKWANWEDGTKLDRLTIVQGVLVSWIAGNIGWLLSYYYAVAHEAVCWVATVLASYGGDAYLLKQMERIFGRHDTPKAS